MDNRSKKERYDSGLKTRRDVLGAEWVDKSMAGVNDFNREFTDLLNTYCWNDVWNRPGLPRNTRSVLNHGFLSALCKEHDLILHYRLAPSIYSSQYHYSNIFCQSAI